METILAMLQTRLIPPAAPACQMRTKIPSARTSSRWVTCDARQPSESNKFPSLFKTVSRIDNRVRGRRIIGGRAALKWVSDCFGASQFHQGPL